MVPKKGVGEEVGEGVMVGGRGVGVTTIGAGIGVAVAVGGGDVGVAGCACFNWERTSAR